MDMSNLVTDSLIADFMSASNITLSFGVIVLGIVILWLQSSRKSSTPFLDGKRKSFVLSRKKALNHNTYCLTFDLNDYKQSLGLPVGKHVKLFCPNIDGVEKWKWNGKKDYEAGKAEVARKYTPVTGDGHLGSVDFVIKVYGPKKKQFVDGGKFSRFVAMLQVGQSVDIIGPLGQIEYRGFGVFIHGNNRITASKVSLIGAGSGITPLKQVMDKILSTQGDSTNVNLVYANQTEDDILLREEIDKMAISNKFRCRVWYTLDKATEEWQYSVGYVTEDLLRNHIDPPADDHVVLLCGPPPFVRFACKDNLEKLGFKKNILEF